MGRKQLGMSEEEVWASTPRKYHALLDCASEYAEKQSGSGAAGSSEGAPVQDGYVDNINW